MDKRIAKRHNRQVARAKDRKKTSEPDVRTPEQIEAAREASRPDAARTASTGFAGAVRSLRNRVAALTGGSSKTDA